MGDQNDRPSLGMESTDLVEAFLLKTRVTDREDFVDQQNRGGQMSRDRKPEPNQHPAGIVFHRHMDLIAELGELEDFRNRLEGRFSAEAQDRGV